MTNKTTTPTNISTRRDILGTRYRNELSPRQHLRLPPTAEAKSD